MKETHIEIPNRFLHGKDYESVLYRCLRKEFERIYSDCFKGKVHNYGAKENYKTKIHWSRDWEYPWAVVHSAVQAGHRILDCGCGGPPLLPFFSLYGADCYGLDINAATWMQRSRFKLLLDKLRRRPLNSLRHYNTSPRGTLGSPVNFTAGSMTNLPFPDEIFDRVFCISVLEHLAHRDSTETVRETARVLKTGGRLLITLDYNGDHVQEPMHDIIPGIIEASGLQFLGGRDFSIPAGSELPGLYNVVGIVLHK